ncbi:MAG: GIY-YIG nuclease family protein [Armatimonadota bacterium]
MYFVYILLCSDGTYYVGQTQNIESRVTLHNKGRGATYTAMRIPVVLVYSEPHLTPESATKREKQIKRWSAHKKHALVTGNINLLQELSKSHD